MISGLFLRQSSFALKQLYGIIIINNPVGNGYARSVNNNTNNNNLSIVIEALKSAVSKRINQFNNGLFKWQKSFHEHIIRIDESLNKIREYITNNPTNWELDENNIKNYKVTV
ncbi:MAG: hypothetical protein DRP78_05755 [Candidatus Omnitrophota bacterium]|nr:MAG: hypothetical protein DRP78_05755 [Candidatus Omnitrophota bacterium]